MNTMDIIIMIVLGTAAGFINTLAGGGSILVVPFLIFLGLPANVANATNRIAILLQNIVSVKGFKEKQLINLRTDYHLLFPVALGSILGTFIAVDINEELFQKVIGGLLIVMFFLVLFNPNAWVKANAENPRLRSPWVRFLTFFLLGVYGGFIQIGIGFFLLAGLVLGCGYNLLKANALKLFIVLFYTIIALGIFIYNGLVDFKIGLILACGNMLGAWLGVRFSVKWGPKYIRYFLLVMLLVVAISLFIK